MPIQPDLNILFDAETDGSMYANTGYDQTTVLYNLLMDAKETAAEEDFSYTCVIMLHGGVYDFYAGYPDYANGSGIPVAVALIGGRNIELRGVDRQTGDESVLRLHGRMQWLFFYNCRNLKFTNLRLEYADDSLFAPKTNYHVPPIYKMGQVGAFDPYTILLSQCSEIIFENIRLYGSQISAVLDRCDTITLNGLSGSASMKLYDCDGMLLVKDLNLHTDMEQDKENQLLLLPECMPCQTGTLCAGFSGEEQAYQPPKQNPILVTDIFSGEQYSVGGDPSLQPKEVRKEHPENELY